MSGKRAFLFLVVVLAAGGGYYYWRSRSASTVPAPSRESAATPRPSPPSATAPRHEVGHPLPGEKVAKEQPFFEADYGFSLVLPAGWSVVSWTDPAPPQPGKRRPPYKIRLQDPASGSLLDFAVYPYTQKSRYAVEEIFISKIEAPVSGYELDIQLDEVVKQGEMRVRRAEMKTRNANGATGLMKTYYYLSNDKLYTFSWLGSEQTFESQGPAISKLLDDIRILG